MRSTIQLGNSSMLLLGRCALVWSLFTIGAGMSSCSGTPSSNSNSTTAVSGVTQNWDKKLPSDSRFIILSAFGGAAVQDNETGIVWEKSPEMTEMSWTDARAACADKNVGGRKGWRLPSVHELASLVDPSVSSGPTLPVGHPFANAPSDVYWSATTDAGNPARAWLVFFDTGKGIPGFKTITFHVWCVRGGMNADQY